MKHLLWLFLLTQTIFSINSAVSPHFIRLFIRKYPVDNQEEFQKNNTLTKLSNPGKVSKKMLRYLTTDWNTGIFVSYAGYLDISNQIGEVTFPRVQATADFYYIIVNTIEPIIMFPNTIHHLEVPQGTAASCYHITQKKDPETQLSFWEIQNTPLPENRRIPLNALIIFAKPKNIFVPEGTILTQDDPQFVLPHVFAKKEINRAGNALFILTIRQFFGLIKEQSKQQGTTISYLLDQ